VIGCEAREDLAVPVFVVKAITKRSEGKVIQEALCAKRGASRCLKRNALLSDRIETDPDDFFCIAVAPLGTK